MYPLNDVVLGYSLNGVIVHMSQAAVPHVNISQFIVGLGGKYFHLCVNCRGDFADVSGGDIASCGSGPVGEKTFNLYIVPSPLPYMKGWPFWLTTETPLPPNTV